MLLKIVMFVLAADVMVLSPMFVKAQKNGPCKKSLLLKMTAATGYFIMGLLGIAASGTFTKFDKIMLVALALSWIGDLFLHLWQHDVYHAIGFLGFFSAHFFFIWAYVTGINAMQPGTPFFDLPSIIFVAVFDVCFIIFAVVTKMNLKGIIALPIILYATVITTMLAKAVRLGITAVSTAYPHGAFILVFAAVGALLFVMSDFSISVLMFNEKQKTNYKLKMFNIVTYFAAELLLAALTLFY